MPPEALKILQNIELMLSEQRSDYVDQNGAASIIGLLGREGKRYLKAFRDNELLAYAPGRGRIYRKADCIWIREQFESGKMTLKQFQRTKTK